MKLLQHHCPRHLYTTGAGSVEAFYYITTMTVLEKTARAVFDLARLGINFPNSTPILCATGYLIEMGLIVVRSYRTVDGGELVRSCTELCGGSYAANTDPAVY